MKDDFRCRSYFDINDVLDYCNITLTNEIELLIIASLKEKIEKLDVGKISETNWATDQCEKYYAFLFKEIDKDDRLRQIFLRVMPEFIDKFIDEVTEGVRDDDVNNVCWHIDIQTYCEQEE